MRKILVTTREGGLFTSEEQLRERMAVLYNSVTSYEGRPTDTQLARAELLKGQLAEGQMRFERLLAENLARLNGQLERRGIEPIKGQSREEWEAARDGS